MVECGIKRYVKKVSRVIETFYIKGSCSNEWVSNIWDIYTISITLLYNTTINIGCHGANAGCVNTYMKTIIC
jgi:hypothetical protein